MLLENNADARHIRKIGDKYEETVPPYLDSGSLHGVGCTFRHNSVYAGFPAGAQKDPECRDIVIRCY